MNHVIGYPGYDVVLPDIVRGDGCYVFDSTGKRYLDLESGVWCTSVGHGHPRIVAALTQQAAQIGHTGFSYSNRMVDQAAMEMLALHGFEAGRCTFLSSGSEAVEFAVRNVQMVQERPLLITMADAYFGAYGSASTKRQDEWLKFDWTACARCNKDTFCDSGCDHWDAIPFNRIGGFVFEPGSSAGLVRFPPKKLVQGICQRVQTDGGLVVINEVTTGLGRTGKWFGYQHYDITPDIVVMGKGIGNGYPVSVAAFSKRAMEKLDGRQLKFSQSHQNDPLGAAVAAEVVRVIRDDRLIEKAAADGVFLLAGLDRIKADFGRILDIRARGLMIAIDLEDDEHCTFSDRVHRELIRRGYICARRPGLNVLRIDPPLTIDRSDLEAFLAALEQVLMPR